MTRADRNAQAAELARANAARRIEALGRPAVPGDLQLIARETGVAVADLRLMAVRRG